MLSHLRLSRRHPVSVTTVAISADGSRYLWGGGDLSTTGVITVYDTATDKVLQSLKGHKKPLIRARFLKDDSIVSCSFDSHVCWWTADGDLAASNSVRLDYRADGFALASKGPVAIVGDYRGNISGWNLKDPAKSFAFKANAAGPQIWAVALDPAGKQLLTGGAEGKLRLWDLARQRLKWELDFGVGRHIQGLDWSADGKHFAAAIAPDGLAPKEARSRVVVFKGSTCEEAHSLLMQGHQPLCCAFSPDGRLIAVGGGGTDRGGNETKKNCVIHLWDVASGEPLEDLAGHTGQVRDLAFSPDSRWLLSGGWDQTVRAWSLSDEE
ncbi:WD40 repeat domain-containing protein [Planctellipticum variicoloris]|uniref:WD40 repeat domain-containing protein n=1 Tax=Planctellipticum variicoloris TaxID=3064265 RepID=UPI003013A37B|nr:hypothetical protein SH412_000243 [Planctomycetaceae bacterium SH412]